MVYIHVTQKLVVTEVYACDLAVVIPGLPGVLASMAWSYPPLCVLEGKMT